MVKQTLFHNHAEIKLSTRDAYIGTRRMEGGISYVRDRKLGTNYAVGYYYFKFTDVLLENLKDNFPQVNFIGIRVIAPRDANTLLKLTVMMVLKSVSVFDLNGKRQKVSALKSLDMMHTLVFLHLHLPMILSLKLMKVQQKQRLNLLFVKSLKTKKLNKKVLGEFTITILIGVDWV